MLLDEKAALWLLGGLCDAFRVFLDRDTLLGSSELPYTEQKLFQVGRRLGFRFDFTVLAKENLRSLPLPCLLFLKKVESDESAWATPALVMGNDDRHLFYLLEGESMPCMIAAEGLSDLFWPLVVLVDHCARSGGSPASGGVP